MAGLFRSLVDSDPTPIKLIGLLLENESKGMVKTQAEFAAKAHEIFNIASASATPINVLSQQSVALLNSGQWQPEEVERLGRDVLDLLIMNGWKKRP